MDWKEAGLNQDADILSFLVTKNLAILSLDVAKAVYTGDYMRLLIKPIQIGSVLAYEIGYVRLNRAVLNSALAVSPMNTLGSEGSYTCDTGFENKNQPSSDVNKIVYWNNNAQTRGLNMGFYSAIANTILSLGNLGASLNLSGINYTPQPTVQVPLVPVAIVNPLHIARQMPLPVAQYYVEPDSTPDSLIENIKYGKLAVGVSSSLTLYVWLWYKNMKETSEFKCPPKEPSKTL